MHNSYYDINRVPGLITRHKLVLDVVGDVGHIMVLKKTAATELNSLFSTLIFSRERTSVRRGSRSRLRRMVELQPNIQPSSSLERPTE